MLPPWLAFVKMLTVAAVPALAVAHFAAPLTAVMVGVAVLAVQFALIAPGG
jgi:hypothetical protein